MTRFAFVALACLVACNDTAYLPVGPIEDDPYDGPLTVASGTVLDSLTGEVLRGVRVAAGRQITYSDGSGAWWLDVPYGDVSFSTSPTGYERSSFTTTVKGPVLITLLARRLAPVIRGCYRDGDRVHALLTDLQGRKSVERWTQSKATIISPSGEATVMAPNWEYYQPPDYYDWPIALPNVPATATAVRWDVYDTEGNRFSGICDLTAGGGE